MKVTEVSKKVQEKRIQWFGLWAFERRLTSTLQESILRFPEIMKFKITRTPYMYNFTSSYRWK